MPMSILCDPAPAPPPPPHRIYIIIRCGPGRFLRTLFNNATALTFSESHGGHLKEEKQAASYSVSVTLWLLRSEVVFGTHAHTLTHTHVLLGGKTLTKCESRNKVKTCCSSQPIKLKTGLFRSWNLCEWPLQRWLEPVHPESITPPP